MYLPDKCCFCIDLEIGGQIWAVLTFFGAIYETYACLTTMLGSLFGGGKMSSVTNSEFIELKIKSNFRIRFCILVFGCFRSKLGSNCCRMDVIHGNS
jgi:hypothetical protein